jgi:hypothetical protein
MLIPNGELAVIDIRKLRDYCLNLNHDTFVNLIRDDRDDEH